MLPPCQAIAKKILLLLSKAKNLLQEPPLVNGKLQFKTWPQNTLENCILKFYMIVKAQGYELYRA
jgi:hypothetical protein